MKAVQTNIKLFLYTPNRFFEIPNFQRPYSWTADNVRSFLSDLEDVRRGTKKHYFGSVVFVNEGDSSVIIDGQQRATTVLLMLTAIYHITLEHPEKCAIIAEQIRDEYLYNKYAKQYGTEEKRIKLRAVTSDNQVFENIYNQRPAMVDARESRLYRSYQAFHDYFFDKDHLEQYIDTLDNFEIVTIILDSDDDNPQKVFESINSTGKPLTDGDKIRNFALMLNTSQKQDHVLQNYWTEIERTLTDVDKDYITDFFRMYIMSVRQAVVKLDAVYPEFKRLFVERVGDDQPLAALDEFYSDIVTSLHHYALLKFPAASFGDFQPIADVVFIMQYLRIDLYAPFALSVMRRFQSGNITADQLARVFSYIKVYFSRRIASNLLSTSLDRLFATLDRDAARIVARDGIGYDEAVAYVLLTRSGQIRLPDDTELETAITVNKAYSQRSTNVNYLLTSVDDESKESELLHQIADGRKKLTIEHIMPQTLTAEWRASLGPDAERIHTTYLHGLANLTLTGYNSEYSNRPFKDKKTMEHGFDASPLAINKTVSKYDEWNEPQLLERQAWWISRLKDVWPMPETSYRPETNAERRDLLEDSISFTGTAPVVLLIRNDIHPCTSWAEVIDLVAEYCYDMTEDFYDVVAANPVLGRWFSDDVQQFGYAVQIHDSGIYLSINSSTQVKVQLIRELTRVFGIADGELIVELRSGISE